jgi:transposase
LSFHGHEAKEIAQIFHVDRITVYHWFDAWDTAHFAGLYDAKKPGRPSKLLPEHHEQIRQWAKAFPKQLTRICALVQEEFGIAVSKHTIKRLLKSWHFSWRRVRKGKYGTPDPILYQQKVQELSHFQTQETQGALEIYYFDQTGFCLTPYVPYAWQEQEQPLIVENKKSKRLNILGFLNKHNALQAYSTVETVNSAIVVECIDDFCKDITKKTVLVLDNAPIHVSQEFMNRVPCWQEKGLEIFHLPTYAPELNLIEILWRFMKYEWIEFTAYKSWRHLVDYVENVLQNFGEKYKITFA